MDNNKSEIDIEIEKIHDKQRLNMAALLAENEVESHKNRARSLTIGTAFGGVLEIMMRKHDGSHVWATLSPTEAIEFINQIAAGIGCHIHIYPRDDFASWRSWKTPDSEKLIALNSNQDKRRTFGTNPNTDEKLKMLMETQENKKKSEIGIDGEPTINNLKKEEVNGQNVAT